MGEPELPPEGAADEIAEAIAEPIADALAGAAEAEAQAAETAEAIAAAAMEGERGHRLANLELEQSQCRMELQSLNETLAQLPGMLAAETLATLEPVTTRLAAAEAALSTLTAAAALNMSTPPISAEIAEPVETATEAEPPPPDADESPARHPAPRRFRSV